MNKSIIWVMMAVMLAISAIACNQTDSTGCVRQWAMITDFPPDQPWGLNETLHMQIWTGSCSQAFWNKGGMLWAYNIRDKGDFAGIPNPWTTSPTLIGYCQPNCRAAHLTGFEYDFVKSWFYSGSHTSEYWMTGTSISRFDSFDDMIANGTLPIFDESPDSHPLTTHTTVHEIIRANCENVSTKIILYYGDANQQIMTTAYGYSFQPHYKWEQSTGPTVVQYISYGLEYQGLFKLDKEGSYNMKILVQGQNDPTVTAFTQPFTVLPISEGGSRSGANGTSRYGPGIVYGYHEYSDDDAINQFLGGFLGNFGYWTKAFIWFAIMLIIAGAMFFVAKGERLIFIPIAIVEILMLVLGIYIHVFSWVIAVAILIVLAAVLAKVITDLFA